MLKEKSQVTLKELVDSYGIEKGLSELVGYFSIACSDNHIVFHDTMEPIQIGNRKVNVPMVIYIQQTS